MRLPVAAVAFGVGEGVLEVREASSTPHSNPCSETVHSVTYVAEREKGFLERDGVKRKYVRR